MNIRKQLTIPNLLTLVRLLAIPFMAWLIYDEVRPWKAFCVFLAIWVTDFLDGYIARHCNQITELGKIFDPVVDKIFQLTTAVMLFLVGRLPLWVPAFILVKELLMVIGGAVLLHKKTVVSSRWAGKAATFLFALGFGLLFLLPSERLYLAGYLFLLPAACSLLAFVLYAVYYFGPDKEEHRLENRKLSSGKGG